jgi:hypothetical protein
MRIALPLFLGVLPCFETCLGNTAPPANAATGSAGRTIDDLIADLSSDQYEAREAATRALKERVDAIPALQKSRRSFDLEVRRRVAEILVELERKCAVHGLRKAKAFGKAGRAVEVADLLSFAVNCKASADEGWESLTRFADQARANSLPLFSPYNTEFKFPAFPAGEFRRYVNRVHPTERAIKNFDIVVEKAGHPLLKGTRNRLLLRGESVSIRGFHGESELTVSIIAASGNVKIMVANCCLIIAGGDVNASLDSSILVCDGDVNCGGENSIIIARGNIAGKYKNCVIRSRGSLQFPNGKTIDLKNGVPDPFAFVKFFELSDVGLSAEDALPRDKSDVKGVRLKEVRKHSPFASQLRGEDVIIALEDKRTPTTELFRRLLRRKLAEGEPSLTFTVRRAGKTLDVPIPMKY